MKMKLADRHKNPHSKMPGKNIVPKEVMEHPDFKPFFDAIATILDAMQKQNSRETGVVKLPKKFPWQAVSNYGITV